MLRQAFAFLLVFLGSIILAAPAAAQGGCCTIPESGGGTGSMPPTCAFSGLLQISNGLTNATIDIEANLKDFQNTLELVGGALGGTQATFDANLTMQMTGTGTLAGFSRFLQMPVSGIFDFGPRVLGDPVQVFPGNVVFLSGIIVSEPDFLSISFNAGTSLGMPGPGETTLVRMGSLGTPYDVESFFDISYQIEFEGALGSVLEGMSGLTRGSHQFAVCSSPTSMPGEPTSSPANWGEIKQLFR